jgi:Tol biopolymer transport system component
LLKNSGGLVTREQFQSQIWPKDTFVDFDRALNTAITKIRLALGDDAEHPRYIETLPGRGYRFIGPAEKIDVETSDVSRSGVRGRKRFWIGTGSLAALIVFAIAFWRIYQKPDPTLLPSIEVVPLVSLHGVQLFPAISPDGNQVAFAQFERKHEISTGEDGTIYTALVGGDKPLQLTAKSGVCCPTWSPDSHQIAFLRLANGGISINVIPALGGVDHSLYNQPVTAGLGCFRLDWSPDGKWLAFGQTTDNGIHSRIALLSLENLKVRPLTNPTPQDDECEAAFAPGGSSVAFARGSVGGLGRDVFVVPVAGGEPRRLTFDNAWFASSAWTQDGKEIVFSSNRGGPLNLWSVSAMGGVPRPVAGVSDLATHPSISRNGNLLAYEHFGFSNSIWRINLKDETRAAGLPTRVIASRGTFNWSPNISPDGKKIVFQSDRLGYSEIWYCDSDGSNCTQLTSLHGTVGGAHWSPDGHQVVFEFQGQHYYDIYVVDVSGGRPRLIQTFPGSDNGLPNRSRNGRWIYFYSSHEPGPLQLWKVPPKVGHQYE